MKSFEEFREAVFNAMDEIDVLRGLQMSLRIQGSGLFNDYYDAPVRWTAKEAAHLANYVMDQGKRDDAFLAEARMRFFGVP